MSDFTVRSDNVDVEQIMRQIRARIREKRGVDYTEDEIRELANVKLEKFLDPKGVRSDLLEQFRQVPRVVGRAPQLRVRGHARSTSRSAAARCASSASCCKPILKLFFNPNPLIEALHIQARLNDVATTQSRERCSLRADPQPRPGADADGIEVKNLKMRVESMASRLDFDERRARALEGVVQYRPASVPPLQPPASRRGSNELDTDGNERRQRRRRRRRDAGARRSRREGCQAGDRADRQPHGDDAAHGGRAVVDGSDEPAQPGRRPTADRVDRRRERASHSSES